MRTTMQYAGALLGLALMALIGLAFDATMTLTGLALATGAVATTRDLKTILGELKQIQKDHAGRAMPQDVGEKFEALAAEAKQIQDEQDREHQLKGFELFLREVPDPALPDGGEQKGAVSRDAEIVGYLPLGKAFTQSEEFKQFVAQGFPQGGSLPFAVKGLHGSDRFLALTRPQLKALQDRFEGKAVATIGADVIAPQRIAEVVRGTEMEQLTMRDLLNVSQTNSSSVEYMTQTPAAAPAAAPVAENALKPETTMTLGTATAPVRTLAVHMPVTEQQLQDIPQIEGLIDNELRYELAFVEDTQVTWGDGTGQNLLGIFNTSGVVAGRTVAGDTLIDKIRRAITDVRVARNMPNGIAVHPYDWEVIQLSKGTDNKYIWVVVTDPATGQNRIWGLTVVESLGMEKPTLAVGTNTIYERRILVGDFVRGATLWDRQAASVAVGFVNDQFIRNQRTLRAEERLAFGVKRPKAFRYVVAQAEAA